MSNTDGVKKKKKEAENKNTVGFSLDTSLPQHVKLQLSALPASPRSAPLITEPGKYNDKDHHG